MNECLKSDLPEHYEFFHIHNCINSNLLQNLMHPLNLDLAIAFNRYLNENMINSISDFTLSQLNLGFLDMSD